MIPAIPLALLVGLTPIAEPTAQRIRDWLLRQAPYGLHGVCLVADETGVVVHEALGLSDRAGRRAMTRETVFELGDLARPFTAAAILLLRERGLLDLDDRVGQHLPQIPDRFPVTIRELLRHPGKPPLQDLHARRPASNARADAETPEDIVLSVRLLVEQGLLGMDEPIGHRIDDLPAQIRDSTPRMLFARREAPPPTSEEVGSPLCQSPAGWALLARVVASISGESFQEFVRQELLLPAGMSRTAFVGERPWRFSDNATYYWDDVDQGSVAGRPPSQNLGADGLAGTAMDLYRWHRALEEGRILGPESLRTFAQVFPCAGGCEDCQCPIPPTGCSPDGFVAVDGSRFIVFLCNHRYGLQSASRRVVREIERMLRGDAVAAPPRAVRPPATLAELSGTYRLPHGCRIQVRQDKQGLLVSAEDQDAAHLVFAPSADAKRREFASRASRDALSIVIAATGGDFASFENATHPDMPFAPVRSKLVDWFGSAKERLGSWVGVRNINTALVGTGLDAHTVMDLTFMDGCARLVFIWRAGRIVDVADGEPPPSRLFLPIAENRFYAFDAASGLGQELEIRWDGGTPQIVMRSNGEPHVARKVE